MDAGHDEAAGDARMGPLLDRRAAWMHVFGRLKPGVTADEAKAGLQPWFKSMLDEDTRREGFPNVTAEQRARVSRLDARRAAGGSGPSSLRGALERPLWVLMAGTLLLLLLASLNVAGLLLARGAARAPRDPDAHGARRLARPHRRQAARREPARSRWRAALLGLLVAPPVVSRALLSFLPQERRA